MAAPTPYSRQTSFALFAAENPGVALSGASIDQEFSAVKITIDEIIEALGLIQAADGDLARGSVGRDQLDSSITIGFASPTAWATATAYTADTSTVFKDAKFYSCQTTHTSGTFSEDLANGYWYEVADLSVAAALEDGAVTTAKLADGAVTADKIGTGAVTSTKLGSNSVTTTKITDGNVTTDKLADEAITLDKIANEVIPAGTVWAYAGGTIPSGWLAANGASVLRTDYPALFSAIGTTYGSADSTHFTLPDYTGRVLAGKESSASRLTSGGGGIDGATLGAAGGSQIHQLTTAQIPTGLYTLNDPTHSHNIANVLPSGSAGGVFQNGGPDRGAQSLSTNAASTGITLTDHAGGGSHNNTQPTIIVNYMIKAH